MRLGDADVSLQGLLIAGMVIGALGVLDESRSASPRRCSRCARRTRGSASASFPARDGGRPRPVRATVNTLVLAYAAPRCRCC